MPGIASRLITLISAAVWGRADISGTGGACLLGAIIALLKGSPEAAGRAGYAAIGAGAAGRMGGGGAAGAGRGTGGAACGGLGGPKFVEEGGRAIEPMGSEGGGGKLTIGICD